MTSFTCTLKATLVAFALLMGSTVAVSRKEIAEAEQERILLEEDENFWGRDLQMSMPPPCIDYKLNFEKYPLIDANGNIVEGNDVDAGDYISDQYQQAFGLDMSSTGGLLPYPRVFDSANPNPKDLDLGTPNGDFGGPGRGKAEERVRQERMRNHLATFSSFKRMTQLKSETILTIPMTREVVEPLTLNGQTLFRIYKTLESLTLRLGMVFPPLMFGTIPRLVDPNNTKKLLWTAPETMVFLLLTLIYPMSSA